jgi:hypothetical protein
MTRDERAAFSIRLVKLPGESDARLSMTLAAAAAHDVAGAVVPVPGP